MAAQTSGDVIFERAVNEQTVVLALRLVKMAGSDGFSDICLRFSSFFSADCSLKSTVADG